MGIERGNALFSVDRAGTRWSRGAHGIMRSRCEDDKHERNCMDIFSRKTWTYKAIKELIFEDTLTSEHQGKLKLGSDVRSKRYFSKG